MIQRQVDILDKEPSIPDLPTYEVQQNPAGDVTQKGAEVQIADSASRDAACGVPAEKAVPLPKRPKAFKCWLKKTIEKPFEFNLKISIDMKEWYDG